MLKTRRLMSFVLVLVMVLGALIPSMAVRADGTTEDSKAESGSQDVTMKDVAFKLQGVGINNEPVELPNDLTITLTATTGEKAGEVVGIVSKSEADENGLLTIHNVPCTENGTGYRRTVSNFERDDYEESVVDYPQLAFPIFPEDDFSGESAVVVTVFYSGYIGGETTAEDSGSEDAKAENPTEEPSTDEEVRGEIYFGVEARIYDEEVAATKPTVNPYSSLVPSFYEGTVLTIKDKDNNTVGSVTVENYESGRVFENLPSGDYNLDVSVVAGERVKDYPVTVKGDGLVHVEITDYEGDGNYYASANVTIIFTKPYLTEESASAEDSGTDAESEPRPEEQKPAEPMKTIDELAQEVLDGKWDANEARKEKLTAAGYDYYAVQERVNELVKARDAAEAAKKAEEAAKQTAEADTQAESKKDEVKPENTQPQRETNLSETQPSTGDVNVLWFVFAGLALTAIVIFARKAYRA